uniref:Docking protein 1-like n=1 Tax=Echeneis naucrates TaxID=173247 RepID=A0A665UNU6_ECHNA
MILRCDSGPGTFTFETEQAEKIFSLIQSTIKRKTFKADFLDIVYANPADCIQSAPKLSTAQYIDPASVLPLKPPVPLQPGPNTQRPDSVYSEVYDKLSPRSATRAPIQTTQDEPIYTEPESQDQKETPRSDRKLDPFAHLYAQVSKPGSSPGRSKSPNSTPSCPTPPSSVGGNTTPVDSGQCPDDVIYENLGII